MQDLSFNLKRNEAGLNLSLQIKHSNYNANYYQELLTKFVSFMGYAVWMLINLKLLPVPYIL